MTPTLAHHLSEKNTCAFEAPHSRPSLKAQRHDCFATNTAKKHEGLSMLLDALTLVQIT